MSTPKRETPRIHVICVSAEEAGLKHGRWLDANVDAQVLEAQVRQLLADSPIADAERYSITESEGFCDLDISDNAELGWVAAAAKLVARWGEAAAVQIEDHGLDELDHVRRIFESGQYYGAWDSEKDWARDLLGDDVEDLDDGDDEDGPGYERAVEAYLGSSYYSLRGDDKVHIFVG